MIRISKTERIRQHLSHGIFTPEEISEITGVKLTRVCVTRWQMRHKGEDGISYGGMKMRKYRAQNREAR